MAAILGDLLARELEVLIQEVCQRQMITRSEAIAKLISAAGGLVPDPPSPPAHPNVQTVVAIDETRSFIALAFDTGRLQVHDEGCAEDENCACGWARELNRLMAATYVSKANGQRKHDMRADSLDPERLVHDVDFCTHEACRVRRSA